MRYICPNVTCRKERCYDHCNHCGESIIWRHPNLDKEIQVKNKRALNNDGSIHLCMQQGTKDHRFYNTHKVDRTVYYTAEMVEAMKDPVIKAAWNKQREEWIEKWEGKRLEVVVQ